MAINREEQKRLIQAVKAGQRQLGWDNDVYRSALKRETGKDSSTQCTHAELERFIKYMRSQGFKPREQQDHGRRPRVGQGRKNILAKIEALLTDAGRSWQYAESLSKTMFKKPQIEWLTTAQLTKLMQALIIDADRRGSKNGS